MNFRLKNLALLMAFIFLYSCQKDEDTIIPVSDVNMSIELPKTLEDKEVTFKSGQLTLENVNTKKKTTQELTSTIVPKLSLEDGLYNVLLEGEVGYTASDASKKKVDKTSQVRGRIENVEVKGGKITVELPLFIYSKTAGFVISEIFFAGTRTADGNQYDSDTFFELYNNSDKTLYADGLCLAQTSLTTDDALNQFSPDTRLTETLISDLYRIPGDGTKYPVKPGQTILISNVAINHKTQNSNSFNLSKSNFEWYDAGTVDVDVPEVPNLEKLISANANYMWSLHNRGHKSYVLCRLDKSVTPDSFAKSNPFKYSHMFVMGDFKMQMDEDTWKIANTTIIDAVELSTPSGYQWKTLAPDLDLSWTHCGDGDGMRYGSSVRRKVDHKEGDRVVLLDTNDSAFDFHATAIPSPGVVEQE
ncbi:DUF4876 domain-containing protein [Halosquirtibacter xylanolyticus]|uniref:DUF4876 domain-containing protein n=1 Tax=Halosquirtibacter xylanolyticus TaxID=3374599 RepID=UPI00374947BA|nr:DUF4876 domain-containing protein [Prolixibacteraceae bacterium]